MDAGVPIYTFDEHNEAFYFWHKAKYEGFVQEPLDLLHIDAHADMGRVDVLKHSLYYRNGPRSNGYVQYYEHLALRELRIDNFIFPAVLSGLIRNVYFVYPRWRRIKPFRKRMNVCSAFGEGKKFQYNLRVEPKGERAFFKAFSDFHPFLFAAQTIERIPQRRKVLLDIDLDYFACRDSIENEFSFELEITPEQFLKKDIFLKDPTIAFSRIVFQFLQKKNKYYAKVAREKTREMAHLPPPDQIESEIQTLVDTLLHRDIKPAVITICRSCLSQYCPEKFAGFIEKRLKYRLEALVHS